MTRAVDLLSFAPTLLDHLAGEGVPVDEVWRLAALPRLQPGAARVTFTTREFFRFWAALDTVGVARDLGLRLGDEAYARRLSVASTAAQHAPDLAGALRTIARYKRLTCPETLEIETGRGEVALRCNWVLAESAPPRLLVDSTFASFLALARRGTGRTVVPLRVELARPRADEALLRAHFGCPVRFGAPFDRLVLEESLLSVPFVTHDAQALADLVPGLEAELTRQLAARSFSAEVRVAIARHIASGDRPSIGKVARRLGASARTLQRRLGEEQRTYQQELDEVRQQTARRLLSITSLDPVEVAFLLGFEEPASFTRAFRAWEGTTPLRWRGALAVNA